MPMQGGHSDAIPPNADARRVKVTFKNVVGEARSLHLEAEKEGAVVQAASQFNCLEFISPMATPELGISIYERDRTQGPACALACLPGTAFRNYLVKMPNGEEGQTADNQINCLEEALRFLAERLGKSDTGVVVKNGYVESSDDALRALVDVLKNEGVRDEVRELIRVGVQEDTEVSDEGAGGVWTKVTASDGSTKWETQKGDGQPHCVTQVYASAISVGYSHNPPALWEPLARLVLEAAYESTLLVGLLKNLERQQAGKPCRSVCLTKVGGGVFDNKKEWIVDAIRRALETVEKKVPDLPGIPQTAGGLALSVELVHFGRVESGYGVLERD
uniref:Uncharacterized protein n=1 Tax=Chromera velia CCMP2878 TaxID=1169474 RepID=A0A0G4H9D7_9ALVE|eukprot:Cvel_25235.t1-p1 / transcript=Cvel_25235.t1 / gene=Cvel_25235 / organism=Chromera_velia_CCMP2878 / gene_product=hypothetical protein / transcript_product=hypothetical protein / location=Cvel_scaffold2831:1224-3173(+) / protein_length=331 / sequence_SO=supercontig / SO=protein_coding / is_pseudo=false